MIASHYIKVDGRWIQPGEEYFPEDTAEKNDALDAQEKPDAETVTEPEPAAVEPVPKIVRRPRRKA